MTWKKGLIALVAILGFYVLVKMATRNIFSAADLQSIYTDALAKRQQQIEQRYRKVTVRIAEINAALVLASLESAKRTEALKKNWEKILNETKLKAVTEKNKLTFTNEQLYQEYVNRDFIITAGKETIDRLVDENGNLRLQFSKGIASLNKSWEDKLKIVEEDRDFWKKESGRWNKKYVNSKKWQWLIAGVSFGIGFIGHSYLPGSK